MPTTITLPATLAIKTKFGQRIINTADVADASWLRAVTIGVTNILRDSYASDKDDKARMESMEEALAAFVSGTATTRERLDPVEREAREIARTWIDANKPDVAKDKKSDAYKALVAKVKDSPKVRALAEKRAAEKAEMADLDL